MRYPELTTQEFTACFHNCCPALVQDKDFHTHFEIILNKFRSAIEELLYEKLLLDITAANPGVIEKLSETDKKRYSSAAARWERRPIDTEQLAASIRRKSRTGNLYEASPELLSLDEVFFLISYPFCSRIGGTFEYEFTVDGRLGKWLQLLREKDVGEERA